MTIKSGNPHTQTIMAQICKISPARRWAFNVLHQVLAQQHTLLEALPQLEQANLADNDLRLAREIISGTCRYWGRLRYGLEQYAANLNHLPEPVQRILELSAYQLLYLDRVPDYAVISEAVELTRQHRFGRLTRVVNGILRSLSRQAGGIEWPKRSDNVDRWLAVGQSHPQWLVRRWRELWGEEAAEALCRFNNTRAPLSLRLRGNPGQALQALTETGVAYTRDDRFSNRVDIAPEATWPPEFLQNPHWTVQDGAAMLVVALLDPQPGWRVWDACAAPGGKSFYIAECLGDQGKVFATDKNSKRLKPLTRQRDFFQLTNIKIQRWDLLSPQTTLDFGWFDAILVDAPCTGWGTFRRHPDLRWRLKAGDEQRLAEQALTMLQRTAPCLKPGGILVYSTCTLSFKENQQVVQRFLRQHPEFAVEQTERYVPQPFHQAITQEGGVLLFPYRWQLDGSYAVRLKKLKESA